MGWIQQLDTIAFHFINRDLSNPLFDRVMPWLSWNRFFIPALILVLGYLFWHGKARTRIFVIMLLITIAIADGLVANPLKQLFARPRPFVSETGVHLLVGEGRSYAMPSSHAVNWAAGATVVLIYGGTRYFLFIAAIGIFVGFSRIYNGVHYPTDVLAGYLIGALSALATVNIIDVIWRYAGKRLFPRWYQILPSLKNVVVHANQSSNKAKPTLENLQWLRLGYLLIGITLLFRLWYIAKPIIELSFDEAYQWIWSRHLALSYYSKPPMIALVQKLGTLLWGDTELGVRFFAPVLAAIMSMIILKFFHSLGKTRLGLILLLLALTTPMLAVGSVIMTVDPLNVTFWTAAMLIGWRAIQPDGKTSHWILVGICMGLGFLSKYTTLLQLLSWIAIFAFYKEARVHLRRAGPWLALLTLAASTLPVLVWNAQNNWITIHHLADRGDLTTSIHFGIKYTLDFIFTVCGVLNPIYFIGIWWAIVAFLFDSRCRANPLLHFLFWMSIPVWAFYLLLSFNTRILPNWIAPAIIPSMCLAALYWEPKLSNEVPKYALRAGLILGTIVVIFMHDTTLLTRWCGITLPPDKDPSRRLRGWKAIAQIVNEERLDLETTTGKPAYIICDSYGLTGVVTFYTPEARQRVTTNPLVYCLRRNRPSNQFYFWPHYDYTQTQKGYDVIFVSLVNRRELRNMHEDLHPQPPPELTQQFEYVKYRGTIPIYHKGSLVHKIRLWECHSLK